MALKVGDIVQLASGGMPMTINSIDGVKIECWWTEGKKQRSHVFTSAALMPAQKTSTLAELVAESMKGAT